MDGINNTTMGRMHGGIIAVVSMGSPSVIWCYGERNAIENGVGVFCQASQVKVHSPLTQRVLAVSGSRHATRPKRV